MDQYLSVNELTGLLGVSRATIYRLKRKGLPFLKVGGLTRFPKIQVISWLEEETQKKGMDDIILSIGVYRCLACGYVGDVTEAISLKVVRCPQCQTKSRVELVRLGAKQKI